MNDCCDSIEWIFIIDDIPPYIYEINNILSVPRGFKNRVRYQKKLFESEEGLPSQGDSALLVLRRTPPTETPPTEDDGPFTTEEIEDFLYPIRCVEVIDTLEVGDIYYFDFEHKALPGTYERAVGHEDGEIDDSVFDEFRSIISGCDHFNLRDSDDEQYKLKNMAFRINSEDRRNNLPGKLDHENITDPTKAWGNMVEVFGKEIEQFNDFDFVRIDDISKVSQDNNVLVKYFRHLMELLGKVVISPIRKILKLIYNLRGYEYPPESSTYIIKNEEIYEITLLQRTYTEHQEEEREPDYSVLVPRNIDIEPGPEIEPIVSTRTVAGKYDILKFKIRPHIRTLSKQSFIRILFDKDGEYISRPNNFDGFHVGVSDNKKQDGLLEIKSIDEGNLVENENHTPRPDLVPEIELPVTVEMSKRQTFFTGSIAVLFLFLSAIVLSPETFVSFWTNDPSPDTLNDVESLAIIGLVLIGIAASQIKGLGGWLQTMLLGP